MNEQKNVVFTYRMNNNQSWNMQRKLRLKTFPLQSDFCSKQKATSKSKKKDSVPFFFQFVHFIKVVQRIEKKYNDVTTYKWFFLVFLFNIVIMFLLVA